MSCSADINYDLYKYVLISLCQEGQKAFDAAWKELKKTGYLKIYRRPSGENDKFEYEYELLDEADESTPAFINLNKNGDVIAPKEQKLEEDAEFSHPPKKGVCESAQEQRNPNCFSENSNPHIPPFAPYAKGNICEQHPMPNGGDKRNTESRNTDLRNIKSVSQSSNRLTDLIRERIKKQIEYDYFEENYPEELTGIDSIVNSMVEMLSCPSTKINRTVQSREVLETYLSKFDSCTVQDFLYHMKKQDYSGIRNLNAYYKSSLINFIREQEIRLLNA